MNITCVWYVSRAVPPFERAIIANMASAFQARGGELSLYVDGGMDGVETDGACSWSALTGLERFGKVLFSGGALWHLWGEPPAWWPLVRMRSRTAHTLGDAAGAEWRGYPSLLFPARAREGEAILIPAFGSRVSSDDAQSGPHVAGNTPLDAVRAAALTMRGLVTVGLESPYLDAILGPEGYFHVSEDAEDTWRNAMTAAESDEGRKRAAAARHHIKDCCSPDRCADSLIAMYRKVLGGGAG